MSGEAVMHRPVPPRDPQQPARLAHPGPYVVRSDVVMDEAGAPKVYYTSQPTPRSNSSKEHLNRFAHQGVGLASVVTEHVLSHPFVVVRRQCQVHNDSSWYHLTPFSLFQPIFNLQTSQSPTALWKGISSTLIVKAMQIGTETVISEVTPLPREVTRHSSIKKMAQHLLLKSLGLIITCPFYAASLVETVQSEIASDHPGVLDVFREGSRRLVGLSAPQLTRQLPIWRLFLPYTLHGVGHYMLSSLASYTVLVSAKNTDIIERSSVRGQPVPSQSLMDTFYPELIATFTGNLLADVALYPLETVVHRLILQGTRTIIDDTDRGLSVLPVVTRYEGFVDCFKSVIVEEGFAGLYKGFGALMLQYAFQAILLKMTKMFFDALAQNFGDKAKSDLDISSVRLTASDITRSRSRGDPGSNRRH